MPPLISTFKIYLTKLKSRPKLTFSLALLLIAGILGISYWLWQDQNAKKLKIAGQQTIEVKRGTLSRVASATGRVVANLSVEIKCKASGEVIKVPFDVSDQVNKGDLLVQLDPTDEQRQVRQAEVALMASQAKQDQAQQNLLIAQRNLTTEQQKAQSGLKSSKVRSEDALSKAERSRQLFVKKLASKEELDTVSTSAVQASVDQETAHIRLEEVKTQEIAIELKRKDLILAQAQVELDLLNLSNARQRLQDTRVLSPINGVVENRNVQIGQIISSGISSNSGGTTVLTVSDLSHVFILAAVDESDIGMVKLEQKVRITADAYPAQEFKGLVSRIATKGVNTSNVVTFEVKIEVVGEQRNALKPEMTTNVEIIASHKEDILIVPIDAVKIVEGKATVNLLSAFAKELVREIRVGITDGSNWEILDGLEEGEQIIYRKNDSKGRWSNPSPANMMMRPPKPR